MRASSLSTQYKACSIYAYHRHIKDLQGYIFVYPFPRGLGEMYKENDFYLKLIFHLFIPIMGEILV